MPRRLYEIGFIASAVALVALVGVVNCLQGTPFVGALKCNYAYTSGDLIVKILGTAILLVFLGLLLGPVVATILHVPQKKKQNPTKP